MYKKEKMLKLLLLSSIISLILSIIHLIFSNPAHSYELNIYSQFPIYFWVLLLFSLFSACIVVFYSKNSNKIHYGLVLIVFIHLLIIALPIFRGYFIEGRADLQTHIGTVKEIQFLAQVPESLFYPAVHLLAVIQLEILDLSISPIHPISLSFQFIKIFIYLIYAMSLYLLGKMVFKDSNKPIKFFVILGLPLIYGFSSIFNNPNGFAFFFLPLTFYLFFKSAYVESHRCSYAILFVIIMTFVIISHPVSSMFFIIFTILYFLIKHFKYNIPSFKSKIRTDVHSIKYVFISVCAIWYYWVFLDPRIQGGFRRTVESLFYGNDVNPALAQQTEAIAMYDVRILDILQILIFRYGHMLIYGILAFIFFLWMVKYYIKSRNETNLDLSIKRYFPFFTVCLGFSFIFVLIAMGMHFLRYTRYFKWVTLFSFFILGLGMTKFISNKKKYLKIFLVFILIMMLISVFSIHRSPLSRHANYVVTQQEYEGSKHFFDNAQTNVSTWEFGTSSRRMAHMHYGRYSVPENIRNIESEPMPDSFGYDDYQYVGENFTGYIIHTEMTRMLFEEVFEEYEEHWFFDDEDYNRLNEDPSVQRLYDNGHYKVYEVSEINNQDF